jgi:hypothetical protein
MKNVQGRFNSCNSGFCIVIDLKIGMLKFEGGFIEHRPKSLVDLVENVVA